MLTGVIFWSIEESSISLSLTACETDGPGSFLIITLISAAKESTSVGSPGIFAFFKLRSLAIEVDGFSVVISVLGVD